jgi:hypothetical protein
MIYWNDPYHFTLEMGRQIQLQLIGGRNEGLPDNFMVRLTSDGVVEHIEQRREAVRRWARGEKDFVARFEEEHKKWLASQGRGNT